MSGTEVRKFWNDERIRYMVAASETIGFPEVIGKKAASYFPVGAHICEIGCGLGYLALAMAKYINKVTAADADPDALNVLTANIERLKKEDNYHRDPACGFGEREIETMCCNVFEMPGDLHFDGMVSQSFGGLADTIDWIKKHGCGRGVIIRKNWDDSTFTAVGCTENHIKYEDDLRCLAETDLPYHIDRMKVEMGQPFKSLEDAVNFHRIYHKKIKEGEEEKVISANLVEYDSDEFPLFMPLERELAFIVFENR